MDDFVALTEGSVVVVLELEEKVFEAVDLLDLD